MNLLSNTYSWVWSVEYRRLSKAGVLFSDYNRIGGYAGICSDCFVSIISISLPDCRANLSVTVKHYPQLLE